MAFCRGLMSWITRVQVLCRVGCKPPGKSPSILRFFVALLAPVRAREAVLDGVGSEAAGWQFWQVDPVSAAFRTLLCEAPVVC